MKARRTGKQAVDSSSQGVCQSRANVLLGLCSSNHEESPDIDETILEDQYDPRSRGLRIDNDPFSRFQDLDISLLMTILVQQERLNVRLRYTSAESQLQKIIDEWGRGITWASLENRRNSAEDSNEMSYTSDQNINDNGFVSPGSRSSRQPASLQEWG